MSHKEIKKQELNERKVKALESIAESLLFFKDLAGKIVQFDEGQISCDAIPEKDQKKNESSANSKVAAIMPATPSKTRRKIGFV